MLAQDISFLQDLIEKHARYTNSKLARHLLENWDESKRKFVKVMPSEYLRVLKEQEVKKTQDLEPDHISIAVGD